MADPRSWYAVEVTLSLPGDQIDGLTPYQPGR